MSPAHAVQISAEGADFIGEAPWQRVVRGEQAKRVTESDAKIARLFRAAKFSEAIPFADDVLAIRTRVQGPDHWQTKDAEQRLQSAQCIAQLPAADQADLARALQTDAAAASLMNRRGFRQAEQLLKSSLELRQRHLGKVHPVVASNLINLGHCLSAQRRLDEAQEVYDTALQIRQAALGQDHPATAMSLNMVGLSRFAQRHFAEAEANHRRALDIRQRTLGELHADTAKSLEYLGQALIVQAKYPDAEAVLRRLVKTQVDRSGDRHADTVKVRMNLGGVLYAQGQYESAESTMSLAADGFEAARMQVGTSGLERAYYAATSSPLAHLAALLARRDRPAEAWQRLEQNLARALLDDISARRSRELKPSADEVLGLRRVQDQLLAIEALIAWVDVMAPAGAADPNGEHWACVVRQRGRPVWVKLTPSDDTLPMRLRKTMAQRPRTSNQEWKELASHLFAERIQTVRAALGPQNELPAAEHLIVLPSSWMAGVPVETLTDEYTISYAPSGTIFARLREQSQHAKRKRKPRKLLAVGDPVFKNSPTSPLSPRERAGVRGIAYGALPGTRVEVQSIAALFGNDGSSILLGPDASGHQVNKLAADGALQEFTHLHFATHAAVNPRVVLRSALLLSQPQSGDGTNDDGRLTAEQMLRNWTLDADLVTLSACRSGLGAYARGEGYLGFSQVLFLAGARSVLLSLWKVDDAATSLLMKRFYENILGQRVFANERMSNAAALAEAKQWLRRLEAHEVEALVKRLPGNERGAIRARPLPLTPPETLRPFEHPYFWAAFVLSGDAHGHAEL